jgi:hypothetical protein
LKKEKKSARLDKIEKRKKAGKWIVLNVSLLLSLKNMHVAIYWRSTGEKMRARQKFPI